MISPIVGLRDGIEEFRLSRSAIELAAANRTDEIGLVARAFQEASREVSSYVAQINTAREELTSNQETIADREERIRSLLELSPIGFALSRPDGEVLFQNDALYAILGESPNEEVPTDARAIYADPADRDRFLEALDRDGEVSGFETQWRQRDGGTVWVVLSSRIIDYQGEPAVMTWADDISKRKQAEDALERSKEQLQTILDNSPVGIAINSRESKERLYTNRRFGEMFGVGPEDSLVGESFVDTFVDPAVRDALWDEIVKREFDWDNAEAERVRMDGSTFWCLHNWRPVDYWGEDAYMVWHHDITDLKKAEKEADLQRAQLNDILTNIQMGVVLFNENRELVAWNPQYPKTLNIDPQALKPGLLIDDLADMLAKKGAYGGDEIDEMARQRVDALWAGEHIAEVSYGDDRIHLSHSNRTPDGRLVIAYADITERKKAEETAKHLKEAMDVFSDSFILYDKNERVVFTNDRFHEFHPDAPPKHEIVGLTQEQIIRRSLEAGLIDEPLAKENPEAYLAERLALRRQGRPLDRETRHANGRFLLSRFRPTADGGLIVTHMDITERKQAEESAQRLQAAIDEFTDSVILYDKEERVVFTNKRFHELHPDSPNKEDIVGMTQEQVIRQAIEGGLIDDPLVRKDPDAYVAQRLEERRSSKYGDREIRRDDGSVYMSRIMSTQEGDRIVVHVDITERKQAQAELERLLGENTANARLFQTTLDSIDQGVVVWDEDMRLVVGNDTFREFWDYPKPMMAPGTPAIELLRYQAHLGTYGEGDPEELAQARLKNNMEGYEGSDERFASLKGVDFIVRRYAVEGLGVVSTFTDVTDLMKAEREVRESETQIKTIIDNMPAIVFLKGVDGEFRLINRAYEQQYGVKNDEIKGLTLYDIYPKNLADEFSEMDRETVSTARRLEREHVKENNGEETILHTIMFPVFDDDGRTVVSFGGIELDITERKKAEKAIQENEARLRELLDSAPVGIGIVDQQTNERLFVNRRLTELMGGGGANEVASAQIADSYVNPDVHQKVRKIVEVEGFIENFEAQRRRLDGSTFWALISSQALGAFQGHDARVNWVVDVSDLKDAEARVAEQRNIIDTAMENMDQGILMLDDERNIVAANDRFAELQGIATDWRDHFRTYDEMTKHVHQEVRRGENVQENIERAIAVVRSATVETVERSIHDDRFLEIRQNPLKTGGVVRTYTDITERKRAQAELAEREEELQLALANMPGGIAMVSPEQTFVVANRQFEELFDLPKDLLAKDNPLIDLIHFQAQRGDFGDKRLVDAVKEMVGDFTDGDRHAYERELPNDLVLEEVIAPTPTGGAVAVVTDITERKQAEQELTSAYQTIRSSIDYAARIQRSILPDLGFLDAVLADYFVLWEPRDIVGGDVYWAGPWGDGLLVLLGDCTGHGVPGAFMTLISVSALERAMGDVEYGDAGGLIQRMHQYIQVILRQQSGTGESNDGIELGACYFVPDGPTMTFAGARFELYVVEGDEIDVVKGTKSGVGYAEVPYDQEFENKTIDLNPAQSFYLTTDGLIDQVGGERRRGFGKRRFKELLSSIQERPLFEQKFEIVEAFDEYQGDEKRRDDVSVMGFRFG